MNAHCSGDRSSFGLQARFGAIQGIGWAFSPLERGVAAHGAAPHADIERAFGAPRGEQTSSPPAANAAPWSAPRPRQTNLPLNLTAALSITALCTLAGARAWAQDITTGVTYVCSGERLVVDSCNMRDTSDTSTCMVGHPDHVLANGMMQYTYVTRGALKKLLPTCTQPSAKELAATAAFKKKQQELYDANVAKANPPQQQATAQQQSVTFGQPQKPKTPEEREMARCVTSGRPPSSCMGNSLLGAFGSMLNSVMPALGKTPTPGPNMAGVFVGAGGWRLDFIDEGVLVNCSFLSPNQENYSLNLSSGRAVLTIDTRPKPLVLTFHADGTMAGPPGPVTIDGVVAGGSSGGGMTAGHTETSSYTTTERINANQAGAYAGSQTQLTDTGDATYDATTTHTTSNYVPGTYTAPQTTFVPKRATCPAVNLSSKGAGVGVQTMETNLLKSVVGGDKGPPTPAGIRMHGIFAAASTGFSVEFFPESAMLGCGPDAARAYPYTVEAGASGAVVKIAAPDHPLTLTFKADGSLDPGVSVPYQVHGRTITGQDNDDNFTFAPMEQTCNLAVLSPAKSIPASGGTAGVMLASGAPGAGGGGLSVPGTTLGNATLAVVSGFPATPGVANPLAVKPYTLLRDSFANIVAKSGVAVPAGSSAYKVFGMACGQRTPDCQKILDGIKASAASAVRSDATGAGTFPGVAPGTYYLMITTMYNNKAITWNQAVQLKAGANTIRLDQTNATPLQ